jgi:hypothetical protein
VPARAGRDERAPVERPVPQAEVNRPPQRRKTTTPWLGPEPTLIASRAAAGVNSRDSVPELARQVPASVGTVFRRRGTRRPPPTQDTAASPRPSARLHHLVRAPTTRWTDHGRRSAPLGGDGSSSKGDRSLDWSGGRRGSGPCRRARGPLRGIRRGGAQPAAGQGPRPRAEVLGRWHRWRSAPRTACYGIRGFRPLFDMRDALSASLTAITEPVGELQRLAISLPYPQPVRAKGVG